MPRKKDLRGFFFPGKIREEERPRWGKSLWSVRGLPLRDGRFFLVTSAPNCLFQPTAFRRNSKTFPICPEAVDARSNGESDVLFPG